MTDRRRLLGTDGEKLAEEFLLNKGFRLVCRNFRTRYGELDLVMMDGRTLVFVEVRTRSGAVFGSPVETVNASKRARLIRMAKAYLSLMKVSDSVECRFDVVGVVKPVDSHAQIEHIPAAFE